MTITRSTGIHIGHGYVAGGGYTGVTDELDATVQRAAEALAAAYPGYDVTVRFNSDRKSGGAWLVTDPGDGIGSNTDIGIGASVVTQAMHTYQADDPAYEGREPLPPVGTIFIDAIVGLRVVVGSSKREDRYAMVDSIEEALAFVQEHGDLGKLVEWRAEQKRISEERARVFSEYVKSIRGSRRQAYAEACWQALEMDNGAAWCEPGEQNIPYEVAKTIRRRTRAIWTGAEIAGEMLVARRYMPRLAITDEEHVAVIAKSREHPGNLPVESKVDDQVYLMFPLPRWAAEIVASMRGVLVDSDG